MIVLMFWDFFFFFKLKLGVFVELVKKTPKMIFSFKFVLSKIPLPLPLQKKVNGSHTYFIIFLLYTDDIPKERRAHFCLDHIRPWCGDYEMPVLYCRCVSCNNLLDRWKRTDVNPCTKCVINNYSPDLSEYYDPKKDPESINRRFKGYIYTCIGMYFLKSSFI